jgi:hypothetical protein
MMKETVLLAIEAALGDDEIEEIANEPMHQFMDINMGW